jgi:hypothetical protein
MGRLKEQNIPFHTIKGGKQNFGSIKLRIFYPSGKPLAGRGEALQSGGIE